MPKLPKFNHPVRMLRQAVGEAVGKKLSQAAFGKMVGTTAVTIKSIELGKLPLSRSMMQRMCAATGVHPGSLLSRHDEPADFFGRPYTADSYRQLHQKPGLFPADEVERYLDVARDYLAALADASNGDPKLKINKFSALISSLDEWLQSARREFGLEKASAAALKQRGLEWQSPYFLSLGLPIERSKAVVEEIPGFKRRKRS